MVKLNTPYFRSIMIGVPDAFSSLLRMDVRMSSEMMAVINLSMSARRQINIMFEKIYGFRPLCHKAKQQVYGIQLADVITRWVALHINRN